MGSHYQCYLNGKFYGSGDLEYMNELFRDYVVACGMYGRNECEFKIIKKFPSRKVRKKKTQKPYKRPVLNELVSVISNESMKSVGKGRLIHLSRNQIVIEDLNYKRKSMFDARVHHFEGYEPPAFLIKKDGELLKKQG